MLMPEDLDLIDALHGGFPLTDRPFADLARSLGTTEEAVIARLERLLTEGIITRFGPLFQIERAGGKFVLAAIAVPAQDFDRVARIVNGFTEVAHNYRRDHRLNMWFVVAAETAALADRVMQKIEQATGLRVLAFPKEKEFFVELRLPLKSLAGLPGGEHHAAV